MRNLACVGAEPVGLTDCLNFGNPESPEISWQFREAVRGISEACRALGVPVISGNVSFYNETEGRRSTRRRPIAMVGVIPDLANIPDPLFVTRRRPHRPARRGRRGVRRRRLPAPPPRHRAGAAAGGRPRRRAAPRRASCARLVAQGLLRTAHDLAEGGFADRPRRGLLRRGGWEPASTSPSPAPTSSPRRRRGRSSPARRLVVDRVLGAAEEAGVPAREIGEVGGDEPGRRAPAATLCGRRSSALHEIWSTALPAALGL